PVPDRRSAGSVRARRRSSSARAANRWTAVAPRLRAGYRSTPDPERTTERVWIVKSLSSQSLRHEQIRAALFAERPAQVGQVLPVNNPRCAVAGIEHEFHAAISATVMPDGGNVCCELIGVR